jgi:osmotically-inducible protein OsmY
MGDDLQTAMLHGDVIAGASTYDEFNHELLDSDLSGYREVRANGLPGAGKDGWPWDADGDEFAGEHAQRLRDVLPRPDGEVRTDVRRMLLLDSLVPVTVGAQVSDGVVTLTGTVGAERQREDAKYLAGLIPGVFGVIDELACQPLAGADDTDDEVTTEAVAAALERSALSDVADLTIDAPRPGTVILSGAVHSRSDHDLAIATAWSLVEVEAVDDCIHVEG